MRLERLAGRRDLVAPRRIETPYQLLPLAGGGLQILEQSRRGRAIERQARLALVRADGGGRFRRIPAIEPSQVKPHLPQMPLDAKNERTIGLVRRDVLGARRLEVDGGEHQRPGGLGRARRLTQRRRREHQDGGRRASSHRHLSLTRNEFMIPRFDGPKAPKAYQFDPHDKSVHGGAPHRPSAETAKANLPN